MSRAATGAALAAVVLAAPALAQEPTVEELLRRLEERDAMIERLEERVERLERLSDTGPTAPAPPAPPPAPTAAAVAADEPRRPGQLDVDPQAAERALERTLVLTGDLLLPPGRVDLEPTFAYAHSDDRQGLTVDVTVDGDRVTDRVRVRRDEFTAALGARVGLPWDSQFELSVPYEVVDQETTQTLVRRADEATGSGFGDVRVGFAKTLWREQGWTPDLIGRVTWDANTGRDEDDGVVLDSGFHELGFSLSALKRQDPLAFTARFSYEHAFENDGIKPGATFGFGASVLLAASPETSLSLGFDAAHKGDSEVDGREIAGSDQNSASLSFGVSSVLGRDVFLNARVSAGLTEDAADYAFLLSVPIRFSVPRW